MIWTDWLALALVAAGWLLLVHHGVVHHLQGPDSSAQRESVVWVGYFQLKDVAHLETWAVVCAANAVAAVLCGGEAIAVGLFVASWVLCAACCCVAEDGFAPHNIANHETWIVACFTSAATLGLL